jgi:hypothetical protein
MASISGNFFAFGRILTDTTRTFFLASSYIRFAPDERLSSTQPNLNGAYMSLIKRADVKAHLSTRAARKTHLFGSGAPANTIGHSEAGPKQHQATLTDIVEKAAATSTQK